MPIPSKWSKVAVALGTLGAAQAVSAVTKANPGVATYVGADPANGTYIALQGVQGMTQIDKRVIRVANMNAGGNTLELEGEDTSGYDTFTAGNLYPITFGSTIATIRNQNVSGGDFSFIPTTTIHDDQETQIPGLPSPIVFSQDHIWDVSDAGLIALRLAYKTQALRAFLFTFANGQKFAFLAYVGANLSPAGEALGLVTTPAVLTAYGSGTTYTS